jgi:uncharacterized protein YjbI with pentapeptide repeats
LKSPESQKTYEDIHFERLKLQAAQLDSSVFLDCQFSGCALVETVLHACRFQRCTFIDCDLSLLQIPGSEFASVEFDGCKLVGIDWTMARNNRPALGNPICFRASILSHCTFIGLDLQEIQFIDCVAHEVDFRQASLQSANFSGTDLNGSLFMDTILSDADLRSAVNYHIDPTGNNLSGARFTMPEALSLLHALDIRLDEGSDPR